MSYDYWLVRTRQPVSKLKDVDEPVVEDFQDWELVVSVISFNYPLVSWEVTDDKYRGDGGGLRIGRFDISIDRKPREVGKYRRPYAIVDIRGSHHSDQSKTIIDIANAINFTAIDIQTGDVLSRQTDYGVWMLPGDKSNKNSA